MIFRGEPSNNVVVDLTTVDTPTTTVQNEAGPSEDTDAGLNGYCRHPDMIRSETYCACMLFVIYYYNILY